MKKIVLSIITCLIVLMSIASIGISGSYISENKTIDTIMTSHLETYYIAGDSNHDKKIGVGDIVSTERQILGIDQEYIGSDANRDGEINMADVVCLERYILGLNITVGDIDRNNSIDDKDIKALEKIILGIGEISDECDCNFDGKTSIADITALELMINN